MKQPTNKDLQELRESKPGKLKIDPEKFAEYQRQQNMRLIRKIKKK